MVYLLSQKAALADLHAADQEFRRWSCNANQVGVGEPAVAPDGAVAQVAAAGLVALTGVHELHVVDVAIGLVEVAIAIPVIAVPDVKLAQVGVDLGRASCRPQSGHRTSR